MNLSKKDRVDLLLALGITAGFVLYSRHAAFNKIAPANAAPAVGFWESWYALWDGSSWRGPMKLSSSRADEWYFGTLESHTFNRPLGAIQLYKWTGSRWERAR